MVVIKPNREDILCYIRSLLSRGARIVFTVLITIGEWTQQVIVLPFLFIVLVWRLCQRLYHSSILLVSNWFFPRLSAFQQKRNYTSFTKEVSVRHEGFFVKKFRRVLLQRRRFISLSWIRAFAAGFCFCLVLVVVRQAGSIVSELPHPDALGKVNFARSSHLYDRNGKILYEIYRDVNRTPVRLESVPQYVKEATLAIEDNHFYQHKGISFIGGILRAIKDSILRNELQGGSTITQQLIKTALLTPERTIDRKIKEIILALWTEQIYTKDEILEMYINQVPYGGSAYGIEEAANIYFDTTVARLTLPQAALLAGLPKAPSIYSPFVSKDRALQRRNEVLSRMYDVGYISKTAYEQARSSDLNSAVMKTSIKAPHFVFYVKSLLDSEFGSQQVEEGGLRVITSLDLQIQQEVETILQEEIKSLEGLDVSNGGVVVLDAQTGGVLAMAGSVDYFLGKDGTFNVTTALRQPGSTLKPILYALALQRGYTASSLIDDSPIVFQLAGAEPYQPVNYDGRYHGKVPIRYALANSYNIPAIKVLNTLGVQSFIDFSQQMGITSWRDTSRFGLSVALGGGEVTLLDLARAYTVFANGGYRLDLQPVIQITEGNVREVPLDKARSVRVLDPGIAYIINHILSDNQARQQAFGPQSALEISGYTVAVKTGTSNDRRDNLTVGYTPEYTVAVWVGNNDNKPMNQYLTSGITGAAPIWNRIMTYLLNQSAENTIFEKPQNVIVRPCYPGGKTEVFLRGTESKGTCIGGILQEKPGQTAIAPPR